MLTQHEPHTAQGGVFCECGAWERYYDGFGSEETYARHLAAALAAHLQAVAGDAEVRAAVAAALRRHGGPLVLEMPADETECCADEAIRAFVEAVTG